MKRFIPISDSLFSSDLSCLVLALSTCLLLIPNVGWAQPLGPAQALYKTHCSACHAENLEGSPIGSALIDIPLQHGESVPELIRSISSGYPERGMPGFAQTLSPAEINSIAIMIAEQRHRYSMSDFKITDSLTLPTGVIRSEHHAFRLEVVAEDLHAWPYAIAPLPDGSILLTEKTQGLRILSPQGEKSALIPGTPKAYDDGYTIGPRLLHGTGWLLDVALHPDYGENGWIYLSYGDRCKGCSRFSRLTRSAVSMAKLIRGRIRDGQWVDQEIIWEADKETYTPMPETTLGARIAFDEKGHVFLSVGAKKYKPVPPGAIEAYIGIQDLSQPYGKVYRLYDDGRIPEDNPFVDSVQALKGIWTYGHRSPHGLTIDPTTGQVWETEMGPRGGDEVNLLLPGRNYGWPLYSKGVNYDGTEVAYGQPLEIPLDLEKIEQPVVDLTPSPAVSNILFYQGQDFPHWQGHLLVGTLKASELYRMEVKDGKLVHRETLISDLARIRDIALGFDGKLYLLLEHISGALIVRLVPAD